MSLLLDSAAGKMDRMFPGLPWSIRMSYKGQGRSFGSGPERAAIDFHHPAPLAWLATGNIPAFLEDYVEGKADLHGDMYAIVGVRRFVRRQELWGVSWLRRLKYTGTRWFPSGIRRKLIAVSSHYDLPSEFILSYLDTRTKAYSCAMWEHPDTQSLTDESLEDSQHRKFHLAASDLELQPDDRFLDIGCGYGYMEKLAETEFGVKDLLGITLSENQVKNGYSRNMRLQHYLELPPDGTWDKIYTCGMVSHLDKSEIRQYYRHVYGLLKSGGKFWMHGIVPMANAAGLDNYSTISGTFSQRYVFPDHYQFPVHEHLKVIEESGFLVRKVLFRYGHYAKTLRHWYKRYVDNLPKTRHMINPTIERAWHVYLTFGTELDGYISVIKQILCEKP